MVLLKIVFFVMVVLRDDTGKTKGFLGHLSLGNSCVLSALRVRVQCIELRALRNNCGTVSIIGCLSLFVLFCFSTHEIQVTMKS